MPEKLSVSPLAIVTAGLANEVEDADQQPAVITSPTAKGTASGLNLTQPNIAGSSKKDAAVFPKAPARYRLSVALLTDSPVLQIDREDAY